MYMSLQFPVHILYHNIFTLTLKKRSFQLAEKSKLVSIRFSSVVNFSLDSTVLQLWISRLQVCATQDGVSVPCCHPAPVPARPPPPLLAGVHVTGPDLLPVLAAGQLGRLKPLLHCHQPLLNASATSFGTFCPG